MKEKPLVSIITPVYNAERYLESAIESVMRQTYDNWEMILVEDNSSDASRKIMDKYKDSRIKKFYNSENKGIAYSRNRALDLSQGRYIAILDDDDVMCDNRLEKQVEFLEGNKEYDVLGGRYEFIDEEGKVYQATGKALKNPKYIKAVLLLQNVFCNGEVMFRRKVIDSYHIRYRDSCYGLEDYMFWMELSKLVPFTSIQDVVFQHRMHQHNETKRCMSDESENRKKVYAEIQRKSLELSGFKLVPEELTLLQNTLEEEKKQWDIKEIISVVQVFQNIIQQAQVMNLDNCEEIKIYFRKKILGMLNNCDDFFG